MSEYRGAEHREGSNDRRERNWHLKKEVPIATILTVLFAIGGGTMWMSDIRTDVDLHWQAFGQHIASEADRLSQTRTQNARVLLELKEMRKDIVSIKVSLAGAANK